MGNLRLLRTLTLNDNSISGSLPSELGSLKALESLDLYANAFTGDVPSTLAGLANLHLLYLQNEQLRPLRQFYCQQRIPNVGKYSYRQVATAPSAYHPPLTPTPRTHMRAQTLSVYTQPYSAPFFLPHLWLNGLTGLVYKRAWGMPMRVHHTCSLHVRYLFATCVQVREEYHRMMTTVCPAPYSTEQAFASLSDIGGDI